MRRGAAAGALLALALGVAGSGCDRVPPAGERPLILITLDTTRADRIGAYGGSAVPTPVLDGVARDGVLFEQAVSQVPLTLPAHAAILTGRYPAALGVRHNGIYELPAAAATLAERLGEDGYETAAFVAAYVLNRGFGTEQGFEVYDDVPVNRYEGGESQLFRAERSADEVNARVFSWLERRRGDRFFLWVHYYDPHDPYEPPEREGRTLAGEGYDREISYLDACLGDLLERLRSEGLLDRSVLALVGDHGESLGEHGERTHGLFLYEGALRVPMMLRAPGLLPAGRRVPGPVELVDLAPTVLELLDRPPLARTDGTSLLPRISGDDDGTRALAHAETLMPRLEFGWSELYMVRDGRFKYIQAPTPELYDLRDDPAEAVNLASGDPELAGELAGLLGAWLSRSAAGEDGSDQAARTISPEEEQRLRSLGYLGGDAFRQGDLPEGRLPDPKEMIAELRALDEARDRLEDGEAAEALAGVDRILGQNPRNHQARTTRVLALIELDRLGEAEDEALGGLAAAETDADASRVLAVKARGLLASVYRLRGKLDQAEREYRTLLELDPGNGPARVDLAALLLDLGRPDEARALNDETLRQDPRDGMALAVRFRIERNAGDDAAALRTAEQLADQRAGDATALTEAGRMLIGAGQPARAVACFETALEQSDDIDPARLGELGAALAEAGDLPRAREVLLTASRMQPGDPRPQYYLGTIALTEDDESRARAHFRLALRAQPSFVPPLLSLAQWLAERRRFDEAAQVLEEAVARNPADPRARRELDKLDAARAGGRRGA